jgi:hypothetical protein
MVICGLQRRDKLYVYMYISGGRSASVCRSKLLFL